MDPNATVSTEAIQPTPVPGTSRRTTLAAAFKARSTNEHAASPAYVPDSGELPGDSGRAAGAGSAGDAVDGISDEVDEWEIEDQPTVALKPGMQLSSPRLGLEPDQSPLAGLGAENAAQTPPDPARQPMPMRPVHPDVLGGPRYAAPDGKLMPVMAPSSTGRPILGNARMERFQELREQRTAHEHGQRAPHDPSQVADLVRHWWKDLQPGLMRALHYQHTARESGMYPLPAALPTAFTRLGDVFGHVAATTRDLAERAHAAASPTLRRWHDQAEQAAQALIDKLDGTPVQQQAPFLGPGRIAVLFRQGVTVGQAQRLLQSSQARPLRLIPRKHGFLALVARGAEAEIAERLRVHPYVRDVVYMMYDDPSQSLSAEVPAMIGLGRR